MYAWGQAFIGARRSHNCSIVPRCVLDGFGSGDAFGGGSYGAKGGFADFTQMSKVSSWPSDTKILLCQRAILSTDSLLISSVMTSWSILMTSTYILAQRFCSRGIGCGVMFYFRSQTILCCHQRRTYLTGQLLLMVRPDDVLVCAC